MARRGGRWYPSMRRMVVRWCEKLKKGKREKTIKKPKIFLFSR